MRYFKILTILLLSSVISFYACNDSAEAPKQEASQPLELTNSPIMPNITTPPPAAKPTEPAQNADGVWHYTCGKGCAGGAGAAGTCTTCGGPLAHNTAYHPKPAATPTPPTGAPFATPPSTGAPFATPPPAAKKAEPAQNASGVWHYTCAKGCAGGAGAAGTCGTCGGALAHNKAYHN